MLDGTQSDSISNSFGIREMTSELFNGSRLYRYKKLMKTKTKIKTNEKISTEGWLPRLLQRINPRFLFIYLLSTNFLLLCLHYFIVCFIQRKENLL
jgi:hypothetical protein